MGVRHLQLAREFFPFAEIKVLRHEATGLIPKFSNGCFSTLEESCDFSPHIAVIANPAPLHIKTGQRLAEAGAHLLIEKPLSDSTEGVVKLIKTCKRSNLVLGIGYNLHFSPSLQYFRELLSQRAIGTTLSVRCEVGQYLPSWRPDSDYRYGVSARKDLGGGSLLELSHELDYLRWIFGEVDWVRATLSRQSSLDIDVEDSAHLTIGFIPRSGERQLIGTVNLDFIRHDQTRSCTVIGEKGSLRWNGVTGEVALFEEGASSWKLLFIHESRRNEMYLAEWQDFLDCVDKNSIPATTGEDGLKVIEIIEAARISAITGEQEAVKQTLQLNGLSLWK